MREDPTSYRGTPLTRKRNPLGPHRRPMRRVLGGPRGVGVFLCARYPCIRATACTWSMSIERHSINHRILFSIVLSIIFNRFAQQQTNPRISDRKPRGCECRSCKNGIVAPMAPKAGWYCTRSSVPSLFLRALPHSRGTLLAAEFHNKTSGSCLDLPESRSKLQKRLATPRTVYPIDTCPRISTHDSNAFTF